MNGERYLDFDGYSNLAYAIDVNGNYKLSL